eukprot:CAMPEP_0197591374 /NCGR_PEP_ID=MMETSP1326-20131121/13039_1 /TAXON_ID=1155430 /ORGANISM="Genus nov. species nov., Strain RCC2288" /LENGTH=473 /DNA_ID=CAMNT_0043156787 /DNA_START=201 /DNA_END=1619 /DNA_ORIENTATION=-
MFKQPKRPPPDFRILKLRAAEEANKSMTDYIKSCNKRDGYALWEVDTDRKISNNQFKKRFDALKAQAEATLDARRERLAGKLYSEEAALQDELKTTQETPEERRAALEGRARALMEQREQERVKFADQMLYQQWREGCDGVRAGDSRAITVATTEARFLQVEEKEAAKMQEATEKHQFDAMYERERLKKEKRYALEVKLRKELDEAALRVLDEQCADIRERRNDQEQVVKQDVAEMKARWSAEERAHQVEVSAKLEKNKIIGEELITFNIMKQQELAAAKQRDDAFDMQLIGEAIRAAEEEQDRENELKDRKKEADRMYRTHLGMLMAKEAESEEERDRLIAEQLHKHEAKRQAEKDAEEAARQKLMAEVVVDRDRQMAEKAVHRRIIADEKIVERQRMEAEMADMASIEHEYSAMAHAQAVQNRLDIEAQIQYKESLERKAKEDQAQAWQGALAAEDDYQKMINYDTAQQRA